MPKTLPEIPPWDHKLPRLLGRKMFVFGPYLPDEIQHYLETSVKNRPLHAPTWVDLAEFTIRQGDIDKAHAYLQVATGLWPSRSKLLWRVAMLQAMMGDNDRALATLGKLLAVAPPQATQVLGVARRLQPDADQLMQNLLPSNNSKAGVAPKMVAHVLHGAVQFKDAPLARAAWKRAPPSLRRQRKIALPYIQLMINDADSDAAQAAWGAFTGYAMKEIVFNGGFEKPLLNGGLDWRVRDEDGAVSRRDCTIQYQGSCSLQVQFEGTRNVDFFHVSQIVAVIPGSTYSVRGYWRGSDITTRSGVFVEAYTLGSARRYARLPAKRKSWNWQPFEFAIEVPVETKFVQLRVRREKTDALDRNISGHVWLDAVSLKPIEDSRLRG